MLSVRDNRRSRSKSPGGRDRDRSNSRDTRGREVEHKKKSIKISLEESESEESDHRSRNKQSSKKYYQDDSEDDRRRQKKSSNKYSESESEESDKTKKKSVTITKKIDYESDSDHHKRSRNDHKPARRHKESESESDRRREKSRRSSKKKHESESSSEEDSKYHQSSRYREEEKRRGEERYREEERRRREDKHREDERRRAQYAGYAQPPQYAYAQPGQIVPVVPVAPDSRNNYHETRHMSYVDVRQHNELGHSDVPDHHRTHSISGPDGHQYTQTGRYDYAQPDPYKAKKDDSNTVYQTKKGGPEYVKTYGRDGKAKLVEVKPETKNDKHGERYGSPPDQLSSRMSHLAVGGALGAGALTAATHGGHDGGRPPASPLLEAYRGTYQSISPMPFIPRAGNDDDLSDLELSGSDEDRGLVETRSRRRESDESLTIISQSSARKRVSFYDPAEDAKKIAEALSGTHHAANTRPLIRILPALSTDDILALRAEYKNHAKVAGQGINIAKHIKMRIPGNLGKAVYATALGRWESEAYWANSWYQGGSTRRELLIESLMGRSNSDIREIKNCFKDKRYGDDLEKCMKAELKADKFRVAILLALEERRMSDSTPLDIELIKRDVVGLYRVLTSREGGETAMMQVIVVRSNAHLKEVMRVFELTYKRNFAREMIAKSQNLVVSWLHSKS